MPGIGPIGGPGTPGGGLPPAPPLPPTPKVISTAVGSLFVNVPACTISFSEALSGPWSLQEHCYLDRLRITAAPEIDQAAATWFYGSVLQPGGTEFETVEPLAVTGKFVKVTIANNWSGGVRNLGEWDAETNTPNIPSGIGTDKDYYTVSVSGSTSLDGNSTWKVGDIVVFDDATTTWKRSPGFAWYGICATETLHPDGNANDISTGKQTLTIYGLLYLAERKQITTSLVEGYYSEFGDYLTIGRGLAFNQDQRGEFPEHGNRSAEELVSGTNNLGDWNADTNNPILADGGSIDDGDYYVVTLSGATALDGVTTWKTDDLVLSVGGKWKKGSQDGGYIFSSKERGQAAWDAAQAVTYLLTRQNPWPVEAVVNDDAGNLDWLPKGGVETDRRTVKAVLDELIQRQRGIGYCVQYDPDYGDVGRITLQVFSFADVSINMPNGTLLNVNPNQYSLDFEASFDVSGAELNNTITTKYHKVIVEGDWRTVTLSMVFDSRGVWRADWTPEEQQAYLDGASRSNAYDRSTLKDKQSANEKSRTQDQFDHVFARFALDPAWVNGELKVFDIRTSLLQDRAAFEQLDTHNANGLFLGKPIETWIAGLTLEDHLTLRERYDYSDNHIKDKDWAKTVIDLEELPPFRKPFSFMLIGKRWEFLDRIDGETESAPDKRNWSVTTKPHHDRAAVTLDVSGGQQQFLAATEWHAQGSHNQGAWDASTNTPALTSGVGTSDDYYCVSVADATQELDGVKDWKVGDRLFFATPGSAAGTWRRSRAATDARAEPSKNHPLNFLDVNLTLTFEINERATIERQISLPDEGEQERVLRIPIKDCRLDFVYPKTVVGIKNGLLQQTTEGGFVRDDRERLDTFAKAAALWYGQERQTFELTYKQVREIVKLGWLITDVGPSYQKTGINSVVTSITFDILNKTTSFQTSFAELDLA